MKEAKFGLEKIFRSQTVPKEESPRGGAPAVRPHRGSSLFRFLKKRCRVCHRPPTVLYYDSPQFGFLCEACHLDAMEKRMAAVRTQKQGPRKIDGR